MEVTPDRKLDQRLLVKVGEIVQIRRCVMSYKRRLGRELDDGAIII